MRGPVLTTAVLIMAICMIGCCGWFPDGCCGDGVDSDRGLLALLSDQDSVIAEILRDPWNSCQSPYFESPRVPDTLELPIGDFSVIFSSVGFVSDTVEITTLAGKLLILRANLHKVEVDSASFFQRLIANSPS